MNPQSTLWDLLRGALTARAAAIAADLHVAEALAAGPRHVEELAPELGVDADTLHRLLRALASDGVFAEDERGSFRNTEASELLTGGWGDFAHFFGGVWLQTAGALDASGRESFERLYGADFWSWLGERPEERAAFDRAMEQGKEGRLARLEAAGWRGDETVVDVGGGNGSLLAGLLAQHPEMRGIVFDLPETTRDEAGLGERCTFVAGSFFERVPEGDVHLLSTILHDWDDERAAAILRTVRAAARPEGRLVLLEAIVEPGNAPDGSKWLDLLMLAISEGRERDEAQWRALLAATGWEPVRLDDGLIEARCR
jgi:hypothetical protein